MSVYALDTRRVRSRTFSASQFSPPFLADAAARFGDSHPIRDLSGVGMRVAREPNRFVCALRERLAHHIPAKRLIRFW